MSVPPPVPAPRQRVLPVWRGDDVPFAWAFAGSEPPGSFDEADFLLVVQWGATNAPADRAGEFTRSVAGGALAVDRAALVITWTPTQGDFAIVPRVAPVRYELKRIHSGKIRTLAWGEVRVSSALMRDPSEDTGAVGQSYTDLRIAALRSEVRAELEDLERPPSDGGAGSVQDPGDLTLIFANKLI